MLIESINNSKITFTNYNSIPLSNVPVELNSEDDDVDDGCKNDKKLTAGDKIFVSKMFFSILFSKNFPSRRRTERECARKPGK